MSSQPQPPEPASGASHRLLAHEARILTLWEARLRVHVPAAARERRPILVDTMPGMLRQLAEALAPGHPRALATEGSTVATEHGGERVRVTRFRLEDVVVEYKLLREVLLEVLEETGPLSPRERHVLHGSIDAALVQACTAFSLVQAGLREQFFATLAHDLRAPLTAARMNAGLILRKPTSENVPRWAARAVDDVDRVDRMVRDLLDAMQVRAGGRLRLELEECDLVDVAHQAIEHLPAEHGDRFVVVAEEPVRGHFAPEVLRRAVVNLATNALKYGAPGRPITLRVRNVMGRALLEVHNHGKPIPPEEQELLFRAFQRLQDARVSSTRGWGLGLVQVRGAAEAHGGSVGVDSLPERGTTFTLDVPLDARPFQDAPLTPGV